MRRSFFDEPPGGSWGCCLTARPLAAGRGPAAVGLGTVPAPVVWSFRAAGRRAGLRRGGVVLRRPQNLVPSSSSTTSSELKAPAAYRTWCSAPRKPLFFRRRAPRLWGPRRRRSAGRGAPLPANPCSFVVKHHVFRAQGAAGVPDVVPQSPQALVLSSSSTTFLGPKAPPAYRTWCFNPRKPLFFRRQAPRL